MSDEAERITAQSLDVRLPVPDVDDEVGHLGRAFNRLLGRVAAVVHTQRQFMADASHELRTPVTAACTAAEVTLAQPHRDDEEYRDALEVVQAQTRRLGLNGRRHVRPGAGRCRGYPVRTVLVPLTSCRRMRGRGRRRRRRRADYRDERFEPGVHRGRRRTAPAQ